MKRDQGYAEHAGRYLLFQHIGESHWLLLTNTDDSELTLAAARRVFSSPLIVAWLAIAALLVGTLRIVTNIFGHYVRSQFPTRGARAQRPAHRPAQPPPLRGSVR